MGAGFFDDGVYSELDHRLAELLDGQGIACSSRQRGLLLDHLALVLDKNQVMNLTRITSPEEALVLHCLDSLLLEGEVAKTEGSVLDIGTGAGYPGIPLAAMEDRSFVLMDSVGKKARAVEGFAGALGMGHVKTTRERAESYGAQHRGEFGAVVARAVAPLAVLVEYARPLLKKHGRLIVSKGRLSDDELTAAQRTADLVGMKLVSRETVELPDAMGHREIIVYECVRNSRVKLPRPVGEAKKKPLA
ncbi:16S rRNA (guanine(527)-N(7))-methyltransferase RsmG [Atopobiaceae bacterium 24-176]